MQTPCHVTPAGTRIPRSFWQFGLVLVAYVGLITGQRDNHRQSDAWEHVRGVRAISKNLLERRNPTYATDDQTPRYGPYIVALGAMSRWSGIDPYHALSIGGIVNTILLAGGTAWFLKAIELPQAANALLVVMLSLYGSVPKTSNSYALADLPWHQVNSSASAFALTLFAWGCFFQLRHRSGIRIWLPLTLLTSVVVLAHGLTGAFCFFGIYCFAAFGPPPHRVRLLLAAVVLSAVVLGICMLWPWYDFVTVVRAKPADTTYATDWYNPGLVKLALFNWHVPAILCAACALTVRSQPIVRAFLIAGGLAWSISLAGLATRTPVLGRLPIPSIFFWHLPAAIFVHQAGLLEVRRWPLRVRELVSRRKDVAPRRVIELIVLSSIVWCLGPQFLEILKRPYLAREFVTYLLPGKEDKQLNLRAVYGDLLGPIAEGDVVLADDVTAWPVPAFGGRIVSALHEELLVPGQVERRGDVETFFASGTSTERRREIIDWYGVKWIIINRELTDPDSMNSLQANFRTVKQVGDLVLLEAGAASPE